MKKLVLVAIVSLFVFGIKLGFEVSIVNNDEIVSLDFEDSGFPEYIEMDFEDSGFPEYIEMDFEDSGFPEYIEMGFANSDLPEFIEF
jgi:hypothetical protein